MEITNSVGTLPYVGPSYEKKLNKLGITTVKELLYHVPHRYIDFSKDIPISQTKVGDIVTIKGKVGFLKNQYTRSGRKIQMGEVEDSSGKILVIWFNQPFLVRNIFPGERLSLAGKIDWFGRSKALISPMFEKENLSIHTGRIVPIYPETSGLSSKWLRGRIKYIYDNYQNQITETLPKNILDEVKLAKFPEAIKFIHFPQNMSQAEEGRKRLAFDELLTLQLSSLKRRKEWQKKQVINRLKISNQEVEGFISTLPFILTDSQKKVLEEIKIDLSKKNPMNRLLEGDVGSGKTVIAAISTFIAFSNGFQSVIMAPTQILAEQHYQTFSKLFKKYKARISLITSIKQTTQIGRSDIIIGTHSLIQDKVNFDQVAFVVIDEQHKFGVSQRDKLITKTKGKEVAPHLLVMTATPIPRTVALTLYGDQDLSVITEMPKGRIPPTTWVVPQEKRAGAYVWIKNLITREKAQAFVICPLIDKSGSEILSEVKAVKSEFLSLKKIFKGIKLDILHGKIKDKNSIIDKFRKGKTDILISTPVVEVGMDIPNASIMLIEDADRFGLAQLHQLRGRIGRGLKKSYCLLFSESTSKKTELRLSALKKETSGFKLAEIDLTLRGPGEIFGLKQSGLPELTIARWQDINLIKKAKSVAKKYYTRLSGFSS